MFMFCGRSGKASFNEFDEEIVREASNYRVRWVDPKPEEVVVHRPTAEKNEEDKDNCVITDCDNVRREGIREAIVVDSNLKINVHEKTEEDIQSIKDAISSNEFLEAILKENFMEGIIDAMYPQEIKNGDVIIEEGEFGDQLFISDYGTFEVYTNNELVNTFNDKRVFGELALLYNNKRQATIKASSDGKIWMLQRKVFQQTLVRDAVKYLEETFSFLKHVPLVNKLNDDKLNKIANLLKKEFFKTNTVIVQENDEGDKFYIIRAGSVTVTKEADGKVAELVKGDFFGENALLGSEKREATVTAKAPGVECLTLTRSEFNEHFDGDILTKPTSNQQTPTPEPIKDIQPTKSEHSDIDLHHLQIVDTLGVGGFGRVLLVQHKTQKNLTFALKYLKKFEMVKMDQVEHVFNEKSIQIQCDSMFITRLYKTFQDTKYLYFLTESCLGGDLWSQIQKRSNKCVPDQDAKFYAACVLEALAYLHERNIVYRDLKPENLLIDSRGYLKLTDLGFAKHLENEAKTFTFAGTPEYVAPEIIYNRGHNRSVDYWAFGILIYELLVGKTPFCGGDDFMKIYNRILRGINSVEFPQNVSNNAVNIIVKLCRSVPTERLGAQRNGVEDIRNHKWFGGFDWNKLRRKKLKAPFVPKLRSNTDTKYFQKFKQDDDIPPDELTAFNSF